MREKAIENGTCRFCHKKVPTDIPLGVLPPGTVVGEHFLLGCILGKGGFGITYRALDLNTHLMVAIKEFFPERWCERVIGSTMIFVTSEEFDYGKKHFLGEAEILKSLSGIKNVVEFFGCFEENNTAYYVMEYLEGQNLREYLREHNGKISFFETTRLLLPAVLAMQKVHEMQTFHRDISPNNIFICRDGSTHLIDFGASASARSKYADTFIPIKTEGFSPPEQNVVDREGKTQGPWSDTYAMTGTVYRCVIGENPPTASSRLAGDELRIPRGGLSKEQSAVLEKGLAMDPEARFRSMLELAKALTDCLKKSEREKLLREYPQLRQEPVKEETSAPVKQEEAKQEEVKQEKTKQEETKQEEAGGATGPGEESTAPSDPPPVTKKARNLFPGRLWGFCLDMLLFQVIPLALWMLAGGALWMWLTGGAILGIMLCRSMIASGAGSSPGERACHLCVRGENGEQAGARSALIYSVFYLCWPLKPVDVICLLAKRKSLGELLSSCRVRDSKTKPEGSSDTPNVSLQEETDQPQKEVRVEQERRDTAPPREMEPSLMVTDGAYKDSVIVLEPGEYKFGRDRTRCNFIYPADDMALSRVHVIMVVNNDFQVFVTDVSTNGTLLNGRRMKKNIQTQVERGSVLSFGKERMTIK